MTVGIYQLYWDFCKTHPILKTWCDSTPSSIAKVLKGTKSSHKGWKILN